MRISWMLPIITGLSLCHSYGGAESTFYPSRPSLAMTNDVLFIQSHTCVYYPDVDNPLTAEGARCFSRVYDIPGAKTINDVAARMRSDSTPVYTVTAIDAGLKLRDDKLSSIENRLNQVEALVPTQIGKKVDESIKANLGTVLKALVQDDPEFRRSITKLLQEK